MLFASSRRRDHLTRSIERIGWAKKSLRSSSRPSLELNFLRLHVPWSLSASDSTSCFAARPGRSVSFPFVSPRAASPTSSRRRRRRRSRPVVRSFARSVSPRCQFLESSLVIHRQTLYPMSAVDNLPSTRVQRRLVSRDGAPLCFSAPRSFVRSFRTSRFGTFSSSVAIVAACVERVRRARSKEGCARGRRRGLLR